LGWVYGYKPRYTPSMDQEAKTFPMKFRSALLEGKLKVTDPDAVKSTVETGIGSAKGFGFGLLSVLKE